MKILVTSDTHGYYAPISDYILENDDIDLLIHAGDGVEDVEKIGYETNIPYYVVKGNNDYFTNQSYDKVIDAGNHKIFLTHGHNYGVYNGPAEVIKEAKKNACDIAIHGHTHVYINGYYDDVLLINPGSISLPRDDNKGFEILVLDDEIKTYRVSIG